MYKLIVKYILILVAFVLVAPLLVALRVISGCPLFFLEVSFSFGLIKYFDVCYFALRNTKSLTLRNVIE